MQTQYTLTRAREAALREHIRQTHPAPSEAVVESALHAMFDAGLDLLRDQHRTDFIDIVEFMTRLAGFQKLELVLGAAQQNQDLSAYLAKARAIGGVWAGSPETQAGIGLLVAGGMLTQEQGDALLAYNLPVLPEAP